MNIQELALLLGMSNEELLRKANEFGIDLSKVDGDIDDILLEELKKYIDIPSANEIDLDALLFAPDPIDIPSEMDSGDKNDNADSVDVISEDESSKSALADSDEAGEKTEEPAVDSNIISDEDMSVEEESADETVNDKRMKKNNGVEESEVESDVSGKVEENAGSGEEVLEEEGGVEEEGGPEDDIGGGIEEDGAGEEELEEEGGVVEEGEPEDDIDGGIEEDGAGEEELEEEGGVVEEGEPESDMSGEAVSLDEKDALSGAVGEDNTSDNLESDNNEESENSEEIATQEEDAVNSDKKGSFISNFFAPIFSNPVHRNLLIIGTLLSTVIALMLVILLKPKSPEKTIEEKPAKPEVQINIRGGFRGEKDLFQLIWEMHSQGYYKYAYDYAEKFLEEYRDSDLVPDVYYKIADILYDWDVGNLTKQYQDARSAYEKAIKYDPDDPKVPWAKFQIANTYYHLKVYDAAIDMYREVIEKYPNFKYVDLAQSRLALSYLKSFQYDRAQLEYKKLIELYPESRLKRNSYFKLAEIYYRKHQIEDSIKAYKDYLEKYPDTPKKNEVFFRIAKLNKYLKKYNSAVSYFQKSIGKYPNDTYNELALFQIAECYYFLKEYDKAINTYKKLIETYPKHELSRIAYHRLGDVFLAMGNKEQAIKTYEDALTSYPDKNASRVTEVKLGELYFQEGEYDKAISIFSDILVSDPNYFANDRLILRIAQANFKKGNHLEAADWYLRLIREYPVSPLVKKAYFDKAKAESASNFYKRAINSYIEFLKKFPDHKRADLVTYLIGQMYYKNGDYFEAISYWEDLRAKYPLSDYRYIALGRIGQAYLAIANDDEVIKKLSDEGKLKGTIDEIKRGLRVKAEETFRQILDNKALEGSDEHYDAGRELVKLYYAGEKYDKALELLSGLISLYSARENIYELIELKAGILYKLDVYDDTISAYEDLISLLSFKLSQKDVDEEKKEIYLTKLSEAYSALGDMFYSKDKISEALYLYLEALKKQPKSVRNGWPLYQIANCYSALNNYTKADYYYERLKKEYPDDFWSDYVGWNKERLKWKEKMRRKGITLS